MSTLTVFSWITRNFNKSKKDKTKLASVGSENSNESSTGTTTSREGYFESKT